MTMKQEISRPVPEHERLLGLSTYYLSIRDFTNSRKHAFLAKDSNSNMSEPDQILAVANVMLAASRRLPNNRLDLYSILRTSPESKSGPELISRYESLMELLSPTKNKLPFSEEALKLVCDAWSVLSDPEKKTQYDNEIKNLEKDNQSKNNVKEGRESDENEGKNGKDETFWTLCPYCYYMFEYEKVYEECCLRCQNCRKAFHGGAIVKPDKKLLVEGKDQYFCGLGFFPLKYSLGGGNEAKSSKLHEFVEISDDDEEEVKEFNEKDGRKRVVNVKQGSEKTEVMRNEEKAVATLKNVKSVAKNTKKVMGRGAKSWRIELMDEQGVDLNVKCCDEMEVGSGSGVDDVLEFTEKDGDLFVGMTKSNS